MEEEINLIKVSNRIWIKLLDFFILTENIYWYNDQSERNLDLLIIDFGQKREIVFEGQKINYKEEKRNRIPNKWKREIIRTHFNGNTRN